MTRKNSIKRKGANRKAKATVFEDLFSDRKYLLKLYKVLHPEDKDTKEQDLRNVTIKNILTTGMFNDLGFTVGTRLIILLEAQSVWSVNIIIRCILYLAESWLRYFRKNACNLYGSMPVALPESELYVIFTGKKRIRKKEISLSEEFFGGRRTAVDAKVKVLNHANKKDIIGQYIIFCKVFDEQLRLFPHDRLRAVKEAIDICIKEDVLKEYLEDRKEEVSDIMFTLYSQEEATEMMLTEYLNKGRDEGERKGRREGEIKQLVELYNEFGKTTNDTISALRKKFGLTKDEAAGVIEMYWK